MSAPLQTRLRLLYSATGESLSEDVFPDLLSFSYSENETNEADEISLLLKDPDGKWAGTWKPEGGDSIEAYLSNGTTEAQALELYCGKFFIDVLHVSGSPRVFNLRAVSIPLNSPIRKKAKTRAWEGYSLKAIAEKIAKEAGVQLGFDCEENPKYDRVDQKAESDLYFLERLCAESGLSLKVTDETIRIFDRASYEQQDNQQTIVLGESNILSWGFDSVQSERYKSVTVSWRDSKQKKKGKAGSYDLDEILSGGSEGDSSGDLDEILSGEKRSTNPAVMSYTYIDPGADENGQEYQMKRRATSIGEAKRLAKAKLRELNQKSITGHMTLVGDVTLLSGIVIAVEGFGSFDGRFIITHSSHSVGSGGYTTSIDLRRVNNNY